MMCVLMGYGAGENMRMKYTNEGKSVGDDDNDE